MPLFAIKLAESSNLKYFIRNFLCQRVNVREGGERYIVFIKKIVFIGTACAYLGFKPLMSIIHLHYNSVNRYFK